MAKGKTKPEMTGTVNVEFLRTGNPWIDAGIVGLYRVLNGKATYVDPPVEYHEPPRAMACLDVDITGIARDRFTITGPAAQVKLCLERAYDLLISTYYDISSQKQREGKEGFYYNSEDDQFVAFPKKRPVGAASLV